MEGKPVLKYKSGKGTLWKTGPFGSKGFLGKKMETPGTFKKQASLVSRKRRSLLQKMLSKEGRARIEIKRRRRENTRAKKINDY